MSAPQFQVVLVETLCRRMTEIVQLRACVPRDDLEYLAEKMGKLKDVRLQAIIAALIGWGDDERAELETFIAISIELMRDVTPSKLRRAAMTVELRQRLQGKPCDG